MSDARRLSAEEAYRAGAEDAARALKVATAQIAFGQVNREEMANAIASAMYELHNARVDRGEIEPL